MLGIPAQAQVMPLKRQALPGFRCGMPMARDGSATQAGLAAARQAAKG